MDCGTFKGWARLSPLSSRIHDGSVLVPFMFPLDLENRYTISTKNSDAISLHIPHSLTSGGTERFHVEAALIVDKKGRVILERDPGTNAEVKVDGVVLQPGNKWRIPLQYESTLSFGPWQFVFKRCEGIFTGPSLKKVTGMDRCDLCGDDGQQDKFRILSCGHNMCPSCSEILKTQTGNQVVNVDHGRREFVGSPLQCRVCRIRVTAGMANTAASSVTANQAVKVLEEVDKVESNRPVCDGCGNKRGLVNSWDYEFCMQCDQVICPACTLQWHRSHALKPPMERLRDLDKVKRILDAAKRELAQLQNMERRVRSEYLSQPRTDLSRQAEREIERCIGCMIEYKMKGRTHLVSIQLRKRILICGWDDNAQRMQTFFKQYMQQCRDAYRQIERVKSGEASLSVNSSSTEED